MAAGDALAWPLLWIVLVQRAGQPVGVVGPLVIALAVLFGLRRLHRALFTNHRYYFTTWRWGKFVAALLLIGMVMKLVMVP